MAKNGNYSERSKKFSSDLYGRSKKLGEIINLKNVITFRSSGIGHEIKNKKGLLEWFLHNKSREIFGFIKAYFSGLYNLRNCKNNL